MAARSCRLRGRAPPPAQRRPAEAGRPTAAAQSARKRAFTAPPPGDGFLFPFIAGRYSQKYSPAGPGAGFLPKKGGFARVQQENSDRQALRILRRIDGHNPAGRRRQRNGLTEPGHCFKLPPDRCWPRCHSQWPVFWARGQTPLEARSGCGWGEPALVVHHGNGVARRRRAARMSIHKIFAPWTESQAVRSTQARSGSTRSTACSPSGLVQP